MKKLALVCCFIISLLACNKELPIKKKSWADYVLESGGDTSKFKVTTSIPIDTLKKWDSIFKSHK